MRIVGRNGGLLSYLLTLLRLDMTTEFQVNADEVVFRSHSLFGRQELCSPTFQVCHLEFGTYRPLGWLALSLMTSLPGAFYLVSQKPIENTWGGLLVGFSLVSLVVFYLEKKIYFTIETSGGTRFGMRFKRSVIENIPVDFHKAMEGMRILSKNVTDSRRQTRTIHHYTLGAEDRPFSD